MDSVLWKSKHLNYVEILKFEGRHIGTRSHLKNGNSIIDTQYPDIQKRIMAQPGFLNWMNENQIMTVEKNLVHEEYKIISELPEPDFRF